MHYQELAAMLARVGAHAEAAEVHASLCARLCLRGDAALADWLEEALQGADPRDALRVETARALVALHADVGHSLLAGDMEFSLLLPDDEQPLEQRAAALGLWAQGFLHGLGRSGMPELAELAERHGAVHAAEFIADLAEISRAGFDPTGEEEGLEQGEVAYAELVEFLRVGVLMSFEELAALRAGSATEASPNRLS